MPTTRSGSTSSGVAAEPSTATPKDEPNKAAAKRSSIIDKSSKTSKAEPEDALTDVTPNVSKKRHSASAKESQRPAKRVKSKKKDETENEGKENPDQRPRLTTPDLEFDFDRSQLRDPRPTPGRKGRPRHHSIDLDMKNPELKKKFETDFFIPKPQKPKGRLNWVQKDDLFRAESELNPMASFHDLYKCHKKGPKGSPTYDGAGFEYDWEKVDDWMKPKTYNKNRMVRGMQKHCEDKASAEEQMAKLFFTENGSLEKKTDLRVMEYVRDHISKDLGIPWHQVELDATKQWAAKGFDKIDFDSWWKEPNEVEKARMMKMLKGGSLRKDLPMTGS